MFLHLFIVFTVYNSVGSISLHDERRETIARVTKYLQQSRVIPQSLKAAAWLENSNKIGFGYNLLSGSPGSYTGECHMTGFTRSIFKLNYTSSVSGSCTKKLVSDNVDLDCLPSTSMKIDNETIDTVEQLQESISSFLWTIFTTAQVSYVKLSMFDRKMELSDNFKYVIENMPCCEEDDPDMEEYIKGFIFDYYGFAYITSLLLSGIAQQTIFIEREAKQRLETQGVYIKHEAKIKFGGVLEVEAGTSVSDSRNTTSYSSFSKEVQFTYLSTFGGNIESTTLSQWMKSVPSNPVIIQFVLQDIFHLLSKTFFPNAKQITQKSQLIQKTLEKYLSSPIYCYNNCDGNGTHGTYEPTGRFQFGICKCKSGWTGPDCEKAV